MYQRLILTSDVKKKIELTSILKSRAKQDKILIEELEAITDKFGDERRTKIEYSGADLSIEDMIPNEYFIDIKVTSNQKVNIYRDITKFQVVSRI